MFQCITIYYKISVDPYFGCYMISNITLPLAGRLSGEEIHLHVWGLPEHLHL